MFDLFTFLVSAVWLDCFVVSKGLASCPVVAPFETNDLSLVEASESVEKVLIKYTYFLTACHPLGANKAFVQGELKP